MPCRQLQCSMPSTPAATACSMALSQWAWAVTGRPAACASATIRSISQSVNWVATISVPGVDIPPLAMTLIRSAPRSTCWRTVWLIASGPSTTPPRKWQCPAGTVIGGPDAITMGSGRASVPARARRSTTA